MTARRNLRVLTIAFVGLALLSAAAAAPQMSRAAVQESVPIVHILHAGGTFVRSLAFSGDGRVLLSGSVSLSPTNEQLLKLWDVEAGRLLRVFPETGSIDGAGMSRDGRLIVSLGSAVKLWDADTGRLVRAITSAGRFRACCVVAISPDGGLIASGSDPDGTLLVWDAGTGALQRTLGFTGDYARTLGFSPDGRKLAVSVAGDGFSSLDLWDLRTGRIAVSLGHIGQPVYYTMSLAYSPEGTILATAVAWGMFRTTVLWDVRTGKALPSRLTTDYPDPGPGPRLVAYSPSGRYLALVWSPTDRDQEFVILWDLKRQTTVLALRLDGADALAFSPDGTLLAAGVGSDIMLWDVREFSKP